MTELKEFSKLTGLCRFYRIVSILACGEFIEIRIYFILASVHVNNHSILRLTLISRR